MFFYPGIPSVYYGDEIGLQGGYDPDCRRCFDWERDYSETETWQLIHKLAVLKTQPALSIGVFDINESDGVLAITRKAPEQSLQLMVNTTDKVAAGLLPYEYQITEL